MKKLLMLVAVSLFAMSVSAQNGLQFVKASSFEQALAEAKKQDKILMVDVYTDWCGPCKHLSNNIFPSEELNGLQEVMLGYKVNAEEGEGIALAKKWGVKAYPTMLFFYEGEQFSTLVGGAQEPADFLYRIAVEVLEMDVDEL